MTADLDAIRSRHTQRGDTCSLCGLGWPCDTIRVLEHGDANPPTQWAYDQACKALERHRQRADEAEAELDRARKADDIDRYKEYLARGSHRSREIQDALYHKLISTWPTDDESYEWEADCSTCDWRRDGYQNPVEEAGYEHITNVHMAHLDDVIAPILLLEADQRIGNLMNWCATHLGNSHIHKKIRHHLGIPDNAYPWQLPEPEPANLTDLAGLVPNFTDGMPADDYVRELWAGPCPKCPQLVAALQAAKPIVAYVSTGRRYVDVEPYPDATARRVNAQISEVLERYADKPGQSMVSTSENATPLPESNNGGLATGGIITNPPRTAGPDPVEVTVTSHLPSLTEALNMALGRRQAPGGCEDKDTP